MITSKHPHSLAMACHLVIAQIATHRAAMIIFFSSFYSLLLRIITKLSS